MKKRIVVIGAGPVGITSAYLLNKQGYDVTLIESQAEVMKGAAVAANIEHADGFEYHKVGHQKTGEYCIDGAITKALFTHTVNASDQILQKYPIRFLVSNDSIDKDGLTKESFYNNAEHMRTHFKKQFASLAAKTPGGAKELKEILGRDPVTFARRLEPKDYADCANIACGYAGSGRRLDQGMYRTMIGDLLFDSRLEPGFHESHNDDYKLKKLWFDTEVEAIEKQPDGRYAINCTLGKKYAGMNLSGVPHSETLIADHIILAAGHGVPALCDKIKGAEFKRKDGLKSAEGTYYLNTMTYVHLPATRDPELIKKLKQVNFTLQGEGGAMFACLYPPSADGGGLAAIYYPSEKGSQFKKHTYSKDNPVPPPEEWKTHIRAGLDNDDPRVESIMQQAYKYYPFLKDYAIVSNTICRTVFNAANKENNLGLDRRERDIIDADVITSDNHIVAFRSPKWTNAELVALIAVDNARQALGDKALPKSEEHGYGPTKLDVEKLFPIHKSRSFAEAQERRHQWASKKSWSKQ